MADLQAKSNEVFSVLEITGVFQSAKHIFIYNSLKDEVSTIDFIKRWCADKNFYLPAILEDKMIFKSHQPDTEYKASTLGVKEPINTDIVNHQIADIIIVPGIAFDRKMNRLGRGKGYYDKFLSQTKATKIGICFDFQLLDSIPCNDHDIKMDIIISENDLIW